MFPETDDQKEAVLEGVRAANRALADSKEWRLPALPDWLQYAPFEYQGDDVLSRFWQRGFITHWNFFVEKRGGWPLFRLVLPLEGYRKSEEPGRP